MEVALPLEECVLRVGAAIGSGDGIVVELSREWSHDIRWVRSGQKLLIDYAMDDGGVLEV
jgi:hypothetical protein